jgi:hypothetical protein
MIFQMMFAIITPALIVASVAERMKYSHSLFSSYFGQHSSMTLLHTGHGQFQDQTTMERTQDIQVLDGPGLWGLLTLQVEQSFISPLDGPDLSLH